MIKVDSSAVYFDLESILVFLIEMSSSVDPPTIELKISSLNVEEII